MSSKRFTLPAAVYLMPIKGDQFYSYADITPDGWMATLV
jgi:hypothetical protein